jgi:hypothetical protein
MSLKLPSHAVLSIVYAISLLKLRRIADSNIAAQARLYSALQITVAFGFLWHLFVACEYTLVDPHARAAIDQAISRATSWAQTIAAHSDISYQFAVRKAELVHALIDDQITAAKLKMASQIEKQIDSAVRVAMRQVKATLIDKDMPAALQTIITETVDRAAPHVQKRVRMQARKQFLTPLRLVGAARPTAAGNHARADADMLAARPLPLPPLQLPSIAGTTPEARAVQSLLTSPVVSSLLSMNSSRSRRRSNSSFMFTPTGTAMSVLAYMRDEASRLGSDVWWRVVCLGRAVRAHILYSTQPHDKSFWACLRSPWWLFFTAVGMLPFPLVTHPWWLCVLLMKDRTDEFIISFQASQFVGGGLFGIFQGGFRSFLCTTLPTLLPCATFGPKLSPLDCAFFAAQLTAVVFAYWHLDVLRSRASLLYPSTDAVLPLVKTERSQPRKNQATAAPAAVSTAASAAVAPSTASFTKSVWSALQNAGKHAVKGDWKGVRQVLKTAAQQQSVLSTLQAYHFAILVVCITFTWALCLLVVRVEEPSAVRRSILSVLYWGRTLYGLFSLPFVFFKLPFMTQLYISKYPTSYDPFGRTIRLNM